MRIDYAPRAVRDLGDIAAYYRAVATPPLAAAIAERIERVIGRLALYPLSAPQVADRDGIRVMLVRRYPYKIFYRVRGDVVEILHIRHTDDGRGVECRIVAGWSKATPGANVAAERASDFAPLDPGYACSTG